jgi:serine protease Do
VDIEVWREGKPVTLTATIGSYDDSEQVASAGGMSQGHGKLGVAVRPLTSEEKSEVGHDGLVVENATGPAARAGIRAGDVIVSVGATKVTTLEQLKRQIEKSGDHVALLIERNGQKIFVPVRVG